MAEKIEAMFRGELAFCSNFTYSKVKYDGEEYASVEHAFQAAKTLDKEDRKKIQEVKTPTESKKLGQKVKMRDDWDNIKLSVMEDLLRQKFAQPKFADKLMDTGDLELVEVNWWQDKFWGQCPRGVGENHLGKLLMKIRDEIHKNGYAS